MSMYTHLLHAAVGQRAPVTTRTTRRSALEAVRRCHRELQEERPSDTDLDAVPTVLAREIDYDAALLALAEVLGIETSPSRFEQPLGERARLERAFQSRGITLFSPAT